MKIQILGVVCLLVSGFFNSVFAASLCAADAGTYTNSYWDRETVISCLGPVSDPPDPNIQNHPDYTPYGNLSVSASISGNEGSGAAYSDYSNFVNGAPALPSLGAEAYSETGTTVNSYALGMHAYTYNGAAPTTETIEVQLEGIMGGTSNPLDVGIFSEIYIVLGTGIDEYLTHAGSFAEYADYPPGGTEIIAHSYRGLQDLGVQQTVTDTMFLDLNPGDEFFVWARLDAKASNGAYADALNTLTMTFGDGSDIVATPGFGGSVVPVPPAVWLFGSGLIGLIGIARRKKA